MPSIRVGLPMFLMGTLLAGSSIPGAVPGSTHQKLGDGLIFRSGQAVLRLQVYSPDIVRVRYGLGQSLTDEKSLAVIAKPGNAKWESRQDDRGVWLVTDKLQVRVDNASSSVAFFALISNS